MNRCIVAVGNKCVSITYKYQAVTHSLWWAHVFVFFPVFSYPSWHTKKGFAYTLKIVSERTLILTTTAFRCRECSRSPTHTGCGLGQWADFSFLKSGSISALESFQNLQKDTPKHVWEKISPTSCSIERISSFFFWSCKTKNKNRNQSFLAMNIKPFRNSRSLIGFNRIKDEIFALNTLINWNEMIDLTTCLCLASFDLYLLAKIKKNPIY